MNSSELAKENLCAFPQDDLTARISRAWVARLDSFPRLNDVDDAADNLHFV